MPAIQSIQRGTLVTTQNDASPNAVVTITPVITANAVVMFTSKDTDAQDKDYRHLYSAYLSSSTQITFTRFSQSFATNTTIEWEVVEFSAGALQSLQTGSVNPTAAITAVPLATPVNPSAAVPLVTLSTNNNIQFVTPLPSVTTTTTAGDTLKFTLPSAPAAGLYNCRWQLIEFKAADASVQSGTTTLGGAGLYSATQAIAPVDLTKTLVAAFHYGGSTSTDARQSMRYFPASSTSLQFDMQPNGSMSSATIQWYTVTLLDGSKIQSGGLSIAAGATVPTAQPTWSAMTHGSLWSPHQFANAYITGTVDSDPQDVHLAYHFNTTQDGATVSRGGSVTPVSAYYQAVDWASSGGGTGGATPTTVSASTGAETSTGQAATIVQPTTINATTGADAGTGQNATIQLPTTVNGTTGADAGSGQSATIQLPTSITATTCNESGSGQGAGLVLPTVINATAGSGSGGGQTASSGTQTTITATPGGDSGGGQSATLVLPTAITATTGGEAGTGQSAAVSTSAGISTTPGTLSGSGAPATIALPTTVNATTGGESGGGQGGSVATVTAVNAGAGVSRSAGVAVMVTASVPTTIEAGAGSANGAGQAAGVSAGAAATINITESAVCTAVRGYVKSIVPNMPVRRTPVNKASMPNGPYVAFTPGIVRPLSTNLSGTLGAYQRTVTQNEQMSVLISCYGAGSADLSKILNTLFRDTYATEYFAGTGFDITPLYAGEVMQAPFVNDANQYEDQYTFEIELQVKPVIVVPLQSCNMLTVGTQSVDAYYSPTEV